MDFGIFVFLAWFVDNVKYIDRPFYFIFTSEYWTPSRAAKAKRKLNTVLYTSLLG
jgi:hypothetical protein